MKTYSAKPGDIERKWFLIDAEGVVLGRLASLVAYRLRGKHKVIFSPNIDCGDHIVIINAEKVEITGNKKDNKKFYWHTNYPGGLKEKTMGAILTGKHPERVIIKAVERMISRNALGRKQMQKLHVYVGAEHPHAAQQPEILDIAKMNPKNIRGT
tara:strand:- start:68 stop:532 length:465 start_codon:yes stop_codon:yes gene_type:complete